MLKTLSAQILENNNNKMFGSHHNICSAMVFNDSPATKSVRKLNPFVIIII